jgi:hypothetical protein
MKRVSSAHAILFLVALAVPCHTAQAWDWTGHRTVARIAWNHMTPSARAKAVALLRQAPADSRIPTLGAQTSSAIRARELFVTTATWPDLVRSGTLAKYSNPAWHFSDNFWKVDNGKVISVPNPVADTADAGRKLAAFANLLTSHTGTAAEQAIDLAWVLHLMGDIHQPLHTSSRVSSASPQGDRGGNAFPVTIPPYPDGNLHSLWDDDLRAHTPRKASEDTATYIGRLASGVEKRFPQTALAKEVGAGSYTTWIADGVALAQANAYTGIDSGTAASTAYKTKVDQIAVRRVALAGYRLAALLNKLFP